MPPVLSKLLSSCISEVQNKIELEDIHHSNLNIYLKFNMTTYILNAK